MSHNLVITIGRQFGSGGREIGKMLAELLDIKYYDKELIYEASKASGLCAEHFERADEKAPNRFINAVSMGWMAGINGIPAIGGLSEETIFKLQSDVIRKIAEAHPAVFVGRCADYILRDDPACLSVFISSTIETRIQKIVERMGVTVEQAKELMTKNDKSRAAYYNYYTNKTWGMASSYNLCVDASILGIDGTVDFIKRFVDQKLEQRPPHFG